MEASLDDLSSLDVSMFVYNLAVVFSGIFIVSQIGLTDQLTRFAAAAVLALGWTLYFRLRMLRHFPDPEEEADDETAAMHEVR